VILVWGGLGFFDALSVGVGRAFASPSRRPFWQDKLMVLLMMAAVVTLAMAALVIGLIAGVAARLAEQLPGAAFDGRALLDLVALLLPTLLVLFALVVIYRLVPNRPIRLRQVWTGALVATALWTAIRLSFTWYATSIAHYQSFFGPVSTAITLLVFLYLSSASVLLGAEVARASIAEDEEIAAGHAGQRTPVV
jgi:membrane protein